MTRVRQALGVPPFTLVLLCVLPGLARAWDSKTNNQGWNTDWNAPESTVDGEIQHEHRQLAERTLARLGASVFGVGGGAQGFKIRDWNSLFLNAGTSLEERILPPTSDFAELPDRSYAVYDWVTKNAFCPPGIPTSAVSCHRFATWMGALNATHFGTQAMRSYRINHQIALWLAARAKTLRERLAQVLETYGDYVREAEIEAMIYEMTGQHYLQDRWSAGHSWERWNGTDRATVNSSSSERVAALPGYLAGMIHGSQSVTKEKDPMCSPVAEAGPPLVARPVLNRTATGELLPMVGDHRYVDMLDHAFQYRGQTYPLNVDAQLSKMDDCMAAGLGSVILAFGTYRSGYGILEAGASSLPGIDLLGDDSTCFGHWATNLAIAIGWGSGQSKISSVGRWVITNLLTWEGRRDAVVIATQIESWMLRDPNGTRLAQWGLAPILGAKPGNQYGPPTIFEGTLASGSLDSLPFVETEAHRDRRTVYGFFNRAHVDYWCEHAALTGDTEGVNLAELRAKGGASEELCRVVVDRIYKGTDPSYPGEKQVRTPDPICKVLKGQGVTAPLVADGVEPYHMHRGYGREAPSGTPPEYPAVANWCKKIPVIDVKDANDLAAEGETGGQVTLSGYNFGTEKGTVGGISAVVVSWAERVIVLQVASPPGEYTVTVTRPATATEPSAESLSYAKVRVHGPDAGVDAGVDAGLEPEPEPDAGRWSSCCCRWDSSSYLWKCHRKWDNCDGCSLSALGCVEWTPDCCPNPYTYTVCE